MFLSPEQMEFYTVQGYLLIPDLFLEDEIFLLKKELAQVLSTDYPGRILEKESNLVRGIHGPHLFNETYNNLARHPRLAEPAAQLLHSQVYVHQFKVNTKAAFGGNSWQWHQDYQYWRDEDGMMTDRVVNATLFLDDVTEFNGPLIIIPRSQRVGVIESAAHDSESDGPVWLSTVSSNLKYTVSKETLIELTRHQELVAPKGRRGSVLFFHPNLVHGSSPNMSPYDRALAIITYNSIENTLREVASPRPDFLASRLFHPIIPVSDDIFQRC